MSVRNPRTASAARILMRALAKSGISLKYRQALEVIAKTRGYQNYHAMMAHAKPSGWVTGGSVPRYSLERQGECSNERGSLLLQLAC